MHAFSVLSLLDVVSEETNNTWLLLFWSVYVFLYTLPAFLLIEYLGVAINVPAWSLLPPTGFPF